MNSQPIIMLAIAPGKRELGIAVFVGAELVYVAVKTVRNKKSKNSFLQEISGILEKLFQDFSIKIVVAKAVSQYQKLSRDLERIAELIKSESVQKDLQLVEITLEQIKSVLVEGEKATEKKAFERLLAAYPELQRYWKRPNKWQNDYYAFLFSAVAVGAVYLKTLSENE
jgi:RNase H-fold protein (predicted Holliday junction resolvase)